MSTSQDASVMPTGSNNHDGNTLVRNIARDAVERSDVEQQHF
jgi:hypothetical protein